MSRLTTRREFFDSIRNLGRERQFEPSPTDRLIEYGNELFGIGVALFLASEASRDKLSELTLETPDPVANHPNLLERHLGEVRSTGAEISALASHTKALYDAWHGAYRKKIKSGKVDIYYWDEPSELKAAGINNIVLGSWVSRLNDVSQKFTELEQKAGTVPTFSQGVQSYEVGQRLIDLTSRNWVLGVGMGGVAALYAVYEEAITHLSADNYDMPDHFTAMSAIGIKRRAFLKTAAIVLSALKIRDLQLVFHEDNATMVADARDHVDSSVAQRDMQGREAFQTYFGLSPEDLAATYADIQTKLTAALGAGTNYTEDWGSIQPAMAAVLSQNTYTAERYNRRLQDASGNYIINDDFRDVIRNVWTDNLVRAYTGQKNFEVNSAAMSQVLLFALYLAGLAIGNETLISISDKVMDKVRSTY